MVFRSASLAVTVTVLYTCFVQGIPRFTREPPSVLYVSSRGTARLVWDYNVENRSALFDPYSPEWYLHNSSGDRVIIGVEDGFNGWKFVPYKDCPARLRGRVSKESIATLVISNVTTNDSGIYGCDMVLLFGSPIRSKVQLIVTERPRFITTVNSTAPVIVGSNLSIQCSATANPMPNVTWVRTIVGQNIISAGFGEAFLRFSNITRDQSGTYECQATNNPNEVPVKMRTTIYAVKMPAETANVSVPDINMTSALIKWLIPRDDGGAPIIGYKILINTIPPREVFTKPTYNVIKNLTANTTYTVQVYARNLLLYGKAANSTFTTKGKGARGPKVMVVNKETDKIMRVQETKIIAGVIGVIAWIALLSFAVLIVFVKRSCMEKGKDQRQVRSRSKPGIFPDTCARSNHASKRKDQEEQPLPAIPAYAKVDKKKKRRPGEILYAELQELKANEGATNLVSVHLPPKYHDTQYADIWH